MNTICRTIKLLLLAMILSINATSVIASTVFTQAPVNHALSRISDWSNENQKADDFNFSGKAQIITKIRWWGSYGANPDPAVDNFIFKFFNEDTYNPGYPDTMCFNNGTRYPRSYTISDFSRVATTMVANSTGTHDGGTVYEYTAILDTPIHLESGKRYWLAITNMTPAYEYPVKPNSRWGWHESSSGSQYYRMGHCQMCADDWSVSNTKNLAFALESLPQLGMSNKSIDTLIMSHASINYLFTLWGKAKITGTNTFTLDDGAGSPVNVESPGFAGFTDDDYVRVTGLVSYSSNGPILKADAADIKKIK